MLLGTAFGAWCSTVVASVICAGELAMSGSAAWDVVLPAMVWIHMIIGVGEALITTLIVAVVAKLRPELFLEGNRSTLQGGYRDLLCYGFLASLGLAIFVAPFACPWPDGLEKIAERMGIDHLAGAALVGSPLADYAAPHVSSAVISTGLAGCVGTVVAFGLAWLLARSLTLKPIAEKDCGGQNE
jgi:cobalt/nickel transport system permease protein